MIEFFKGKKTYIAATLLALGSLGSYLAGHIDGPALFEGIMLAASVAGLRAGVAKAE